MMSTADTVAALAKGALWRVTGANWLATELIETAISGDEDSSTEAAMMLTKGGARAIGPVTEAIARGSSGLVGILVAIGTDDARKALVHLSSSSNTDIAGRARDGVHRIDRARELGRTYGH